MKTYALQWWTYALLCCACSELTDAQPGSAGKGAKSPARSSDAGSVAGSAAAGLGTARRGVGSDPSSPTAGASGARAAGSATSASARAGAGGMGGGGNGSATAGRVATNRGAGAASGAGAGPSGSGGRAAGGGAGGSGGGSGSTAVMQPETAALEREFCGERGVPASGSGTAVSGTIANQTWTAAQSPYVLTGDTLVASLTIEPGVEIRADGAFTLEVGGKLTAIGTAPLPIVFRASGATGWRGIFFNAAQASELAHCVVEDATNSGIRIVDSSPVIRNSCIQRNTATQGGGVFISGAMAAPTLKNNLINDNLASDSFEAGGGVFVRGGSMATAITNTLIVGNHTVYANARGGGLFACSGVTSLTNVVLVDNGKSMYGNGSGGIAINTGGLSNCTSASVNMQSSIVFNNTPFQISGEGATVTFSDVQGGFAGMGNISTNPLFMSPGYHLLQGASPCIDAGATDADVDACLPPSLGSSRNDMGIYGGPSACNFAPP